MIVSSFRSVIQTVKHRHLDKSIGRAESITTPPGRIINVVSVLNVAAIAAGIATLSDNNKLVPRWFSFDLAKSSFDQAHLAASCSGDGTSY